MPQLSTSFYIFSRAAELYAARSGSRTARVRAIRDLSVMQERESKQVQAIRDLSLMQERENTQKKKAGAQKTQSGGVLLQTAARKHAKTMNYPFCEAH